MFFALLHHCWHCHRLSGCSALNDETGGSPLCLPVQHSPQAFTSRRAEGDVLGLKHRNGIGEFWLARPRRGNDTILAGIRGP